MWAKEHVEGIANWGFWSPMCFTAGETVTFGKQLYTAGGEVWPWHRYQIMKLCKAPPF